jgi:hypothetical protein
MIVTVAERRRTHAYISRLRDLERFQYTDLDNAGKLDGYFCVELYSPPEHQLIEILFRWEFWLGLVWLSFGDPLPDDQLIKLFNSAESVAAGTTDDGGMLEWCGMMADETQFWWQNPGETLSDIKALAAKVGTTTGWHVSETQSH